MRTLLFLLSIVVFRLSQGQDYTRLRGYQYEGTDSMKKILVLEHTLDSLGRITHLRSTNWKENRDDESYDHTVLHFYKDSLLTETLTISSGNDSMRRLYFYNDKGKASGEELSKSMHISLEFEEVYKWVKLHESVYTYEKHGDGTLLQMTFIPKTPKVYSWKYDSLDRVIQHRCSDGEKIVYSHDYEYFKGGYRQTQKYFDSDGHAKDPIRVITVYLNEDGKIIHEETTENGEKTGTKLYSYDEKGRMIKNVNLNGKGEPEITHLYEYY